MKVFFIIFLTTLIPLAAKAEIRKYIHRSHGTMATVYGFGEKMCGDPGRARRCNQFAITASGQKFDPRKASAAIALPPKFKMPSEGIDVWMRLEEGPCIKININDKKNYRFSKTRPIDLSVGAVRALGGDPHKGWGGKVFLCELEMETEKIKQPKEITRLFSDVIEITEPITLD